MPDRNKRGASQRVYAQFLCSFPSAGTSTTWMCSTSQSRSRTTQKHCKSFIPPACLLAAGMCLPASACLLVKAIKQLACGCWWGACTRLSTAADPARLSLPCTASPSPRLCPPASLLCSDRPGCELVANGTRWEDSRYPKSGALVNCNLRFGPESMHRMINFVDSAMMRWASLHNRPDVVASIRKQPAGGEGAGAQGAGSALGAAAVQ